jgi:hypothetical protein
VLEAESTLSIIVLPLFTVVHNACSLQWLKIATRSLSKTHTTLLAVALSVLPCCEPARIVSWKC